MSTMHLAVLLALMALTVMVLAAMLIVQKSKVKNAFESVSKDRKALEEKEKLLYKEAKIKAVDGGLHVFSDFLCLLLLDVLWR